MKDILRLIVIVMTSSAWCSIAEAQQPKKVPLLGYLSGFDQATDSARAEAIRSALREFGYMESETSQSNTGIRRQSSIGPLSLPPS